MKYFILAGVVGVLVLGICSDAVAQEEEEKFKEDFPTNLWPFLRVLRQTDKYRLELLWPLFEYERRPDGYKHLALRPLYTRTKDPKKKLSSLSLAWPLFSIAKEANDTRLTLFPLLWHANSPERSYTVAFPVFWRYRWPDNTRTVVFPFYWRWRWGKDTTTFVFPFFWHNKWGKDFTTVVFPLYARWRSEGSLTTAITPLYWRSRSSTGDQVSALLPFYWRKVDGAGNRFTTLFPLYWASRIITEDYSTVLFPVYWSMKEGECSRFHIWPLFGVDKWGEWYRRYSFLFPFIWYEKYIPPSDTEIIEHGITKEEKYRATFRVNPLFAYRKGPRALSTYFFPLYIYNRDYDAESSDLSLLWPLFRRASNKSETRSHLFPLYHYKHEKKAGKTGFSFLWLPFIESWSLFRYESDKHTTRSRFFPFYSYAHTKGGGKNFSLLWPLFTYAAKGDRKSFALLWKLCDYHRDGKGNHHFAVFWKFIREEKRGESYSFEVNPFYSYYRHGEDYKVGILGGLIYSKKKRGAKVTKRILLIPF